MDICRLNFNLVSFEGDLRGLMSIRKTIRSLRMCNDVITQKIVTSTTFILLLVKTTMSLLAACAIRDYLVKRS